MACDRGQNQTARLCAVRNGLSAAGSKAANLLGIGVARGLRQAGRASGAALAVANAIEGPKRLDNLLPLAVIGAIATDMQAGRRPVIEPDDDGEERRARGRPANWRNRSLNLIAALKLARAGSGSLGTSLARLSRPPSEAISRRNYFGGRVVLRAWNSRLSAAFNALDVPPGITVKSSAGRMIEYQGQAWHAGTTVVETSAGERAITHLKRLQWPAQQYYFGRGLSDQEIAGILSGHQDYEPKHLPGFVGEVGEVEALLPGLARLKRGLIKNYLLWGE